MGSFQNERHSSPYNLFSMSTLVLTARIDSNGILDLKDLSPMVIMMVIYFYAFRSSAVDKRQPQNAMGH